MKFLITAKTAGGTQDFYAIGAAARDALVDSLYEQGMLGLFTARIA
jgi:hypothetical protein